MGRFGLLETNRQSAVRGFAPPLDYAPDAWLMGRFGLLETNRQSAVRGFAPPLDYAPDGATLEASGGGA